MNITPHGRRLLLVVAVAMTSPLVLTPLVGTAEGQTLFSDDFESGVLSPAKWQSFTTDQGFPRPTSAQVVANPLPGPSNPSSNVIQFAQQGSGGDLFSTLIQHQSPVTLSFDVLKTTTVGYGFIGTDHANPARGDNPQWLWNTDQFDAGENGNIPADQWIHVSITFSPFDNGGTRDFVLMLEQSGIAPFSPTDPPSVFFDNILVESSTTTILTAVKDSFLRQGNPDRNEGANPTMRIQASGHNRAVVAFDLSGVNVASVTSAELVLTVAEIATNWGTEGRTVDAHSLLVDFAEGNGQNAGVPGSQSTRGSGAGVTWNCASDTEISNQQTNCTLTWDGGDFAPATALSVLHFNTLTGQVEWDVTADVQAGGSRWLIKKTNEGNTGEVAYYSREGSLQVTGNLSLAPTLVLRFN